MRTISHSLCCCCDHFLFSFLPRSTSACMLIPPPEAVVSRRPIKTLLSVGRFHLLHSGIAFSFSSAWTPYPSAYPPPLSPPLCGPRYSTLSAQSRFSLYVGSCSCLPSAPQLSTSVRLSSLQFFFSFPDHIFLVPLVSLQLLWSHVHQNAL